MNDDAVARCSDCDKLPAETECCNLSFFTKEKFLTCHVLVTCCKDVTVDTGTIVKLQHVKGSYSVDSNLTETGGIPVYKKNDNEKRCLWWSKGNKKWYIGICEHHGSNGGYGNISLKRSFISNSGQK